MKNDNFIEFTRWELLQMLSEILSKEFLIKTVCYFIENSFISSVLFHACIPLFFNPWLCEAYEITYDSR